MKASLEELEPRLTPSTLLDQAQAVTHSALFWNHFTTNLYGSLLGRSPSPTETSGWTSSLENGANPQDVKAAFLASPEYVARNPSWIDSLYLAALGRFASPSELAGWNPTPSLNTALTICHSREAQLYAIHGAYGDFLHRVTSPTELQGWLGTPYPTIAAHILASPEYSNSHPHDTWQSAVAADLY